MNKQLAERIKKEAYEIIKLKCISEDYLLNNCSFQTFYTDSCPVNLTDLSYYLFYKYHKNKKSPFPGKLKNSYSTFHDEIVNIVLSCFSAVQSGLTLEDEFSHESCAGSVLKQIFEMGKQVEYNHPWCDFDCNHMCEVDRISKDKEYIKYVKSYIRDKYDTIKRQAKEFEKSITKGDK